jgi:hypothetical protein
MEHLKRSHPYSRIAANVVYNEYINDRCAAAAGLQASVVDRACFRSSRKQRQ